MTDNTVSLLPCPFCGCEFSEPDTQNYKWSYVTCPQCDADGPLSNSHAEGLRLWNIRTTPQPPSAGEWMPIETAPMDGTEILGFRSDAGRFLVRWTCLSDFEMESENHKYSVEDWEAYDWFYADFVAGGRLDPSEYPTHWMPLPGAQKP